MVTQAEIELLELTTAFAQSLGNEGAQKIVNDAVAETKLPLRQTYSVSEMMTICGVLKRRPGFIGMIGASLMSKYAVRKDV